jgi:hypothetical protein
MFFQRIRNWLSEIVMANDIITLEYEPDKLEPENNQEFIQKIIRSAKHSPPIQHLPLELHLMILEFLPFSKETISLNRVCKQFFVLMKNQTLWKNWCKQLNLVNDKYQPIRRTRDFYFEYYGSFFQQTFDCEDLVPI